MLRVRLTLLLLLTVVGGAGSVGAAEPVRIAIIIDDLGNNRALGREAVALPGALTYAVLPSRPYSSYIAQTADASGKEVMLHLPMEASDGRAMGPGGLSLGMDRKSFAHAVREGIESLPNIAGVNNHMGSLLTRQPDAMRWLMEELRCFDRLYFVDSRTDVRTVARDSARDAGLANAARDVFLDNQQDREYIRAQLARLIAIARRHGSAIGIGHPYPETLAVLAEQLPQLSVQGIQLVPVSRLVERERSERLWHASSSPLPKVAKNSKQ
ncbi:MAG: divergent polysaccharide deacetylase family protein [Gammaproteobacteria bacterium]|nr:divergent polysaccharide deacetylase family protein [Gammaproteobacteria bacterium]